jgi:predicted Zn-dependent protease
LLPLIIGIADPKYFRIHLMISMYQSNGPSNLIHHPLVILSKSFHTQHHSLVSNRLRSESSTTNQVFARFNKSISLISIIDEGLYNDEENFNSSDTFHWLQVAIISDRRLRALRMYILY